MRERVASVTPPAFVISIITASDYHDHEGPDIFASTFLLRRVARYKVSDPRDFRMIDRRGNVECCGKFVIPLNFAFSRFFSWEGGGECLSKISLYVFRRIRITWPRN